MRGSGSGRAGRYGRRRGRKIRLSMSCILGYFFLGSKFLRSYGWPVRDDIDGVIDQWRVARPELDASPIGVVGRVSRLARELEARLETVCRAHGLEPGWHDVLATLRRAGDPYRLRVTDLTASMMIGSSGTTKR